MKLISTKICTILCFAAASSGATAELFDNESIFKSKHHRSIGMVWNADTQLRVRHARSVIKRTEERVCITTKTRDLAAGAYTNWWVIYNEPEYCSNPSGFGDVSCGPPDIANPLVRATVMLATGGIVGPNGRAHFNTCIETGELTHSVFPMGTQEGLVNNYGAEIQQVIRYHGPAEYDFPELLGLQLSEYNGGCEEEESQQNGFACADAQMVTHVPKSY